VYVFARVLFEIRTTQQSATCSIVGWPPKRLSSRSAVFFRPGVLIALSFSQGEIQPDFQECYFSFLNRLKSRNSEIWLSRGSSVFTLNLLVELDHVHFV